MATGRKMEAETILKITRAPCLSVVQKTYDVCCVLGKSLPMLNDLGLTRLKCHLLNPGPHDFKANILSTWVPLII